MPSRRNPKLTQRTIEGRNVVFYGKVPMRDVAAAKRFDGAEQNVMIVGPFGFVAEMFGIHPKSHVLYLFADPKARAASYEGMRSGTMDYAVFSHYRAGMAGRGTLDAFWSQRATKKMAAAVQYFLDGKTLVVTHMAVQPKWRRSRINTWLIDMIVDATEAEKVAFESPTADGMEFMRSYGGSEYKY